MRPAAFTDEEWDLQSLIDESEHECAYCGEDIHSVEELRLLQVVYPNKVGGKLEFYAIENDTGDEYQYSPYLFHFMCWEEVEESLAEELESRGPMPQEDGICKCDACGAGVRAWETTGLLSFGELRRSHITPNGDSTFYFDECNSEPRVICISCLWTINNEILEMWPNGISHNGECNEGTLHRCWRDGGCRHGCRLAKSE